MKIVLEGNVNTLKAALMSFIVAAERETEDETDPEGAELIDKDGNEAQNFLNQIEAQE